MTRLLAVFPAAICLIAATLNAQDDTLNVLFLGNSYTYVNDLPSMFADLSLSGGRPVIVDSNAPGGYTLEQHTTNQVTLDKISRGTWDYVVLQEQSQIPTIDYWRYNSMYPSARILDSLITLHDGATAFFMTWGHKYGGQQTIGSYSSPVFVDFFHMQDSLNSAYSQIADELSAVLCPVGNAWATAVRMDSTVDLWQSDNSHPTLRGSYLAACVFYGVFFDISPMGLPYTAGLPWEDAYFLQTAASQTLPVTEPRSRDFPASVTLLQNYPNPFNSVTIIPYTMQTNGRIELTIFDILGRKVVTLVDDHRTAGTYSVSWDGKAAAGKGVGSGLYFCRYQTEDVTVYRTLIFLK